ncbi:MAG: zinc-dependent peptidase [Desulfuromonadaceae bacterium]|nr:zinc-dependent peptidase [Desulfuromonadaceae bacterium]
MFHWLRDHHRAEVRSRPFPAEWDKFVSANVPHFGLLDAAECAELCAMTQVFLEEKQWEGCGGLELTDEIRVTISVQACLLQLGLPHDYYRNVDSILVYPSTVVIPEQHPGVFQRVEGTLDGDVPILGQAFTHGPVILVWDAVLKGSRHPERGHNVVYHEFAHKLDMLDGAVDGTPPLADGVQLTEWVEVCSREFLRLRQLTEQGHKTFLDSYGAKNEGEFFAVATEEFFDRPQLLQQHAPDLYHVLSTYYHQDPAERLLRFEAAPAEHPAHLTLSLKNPQDSNEAV